MRGFGVIATLIILCPNAFAVDDLKVDNGIKVELSVGSPTLTITNPDSTIANYKGLGIGAKGFMPIAFGQMYRMDVTTGFRYFDFENTANQKQSEYAKYLGPGAGLEFSLSRFFVGADYYYLKGRHTSVGPFSEKSEFAVSGLNYYGGVRFRFTLGSLGLGWSHMVSAVPGDEVGLTKDSKWSNTVYWLQLTHSFKTDGKGFFKSLFGN